MACLIDRLLDCNAPPGVFDVVAGPVKPCACTKLAGELNLVTAQDTPFWLAHSQLAQCCSSKTKDHRPHILRAEETCRQQSLAAASRPYMIDADLLRLLAVAL